MITFAKWAINNRCNLNCPFCVMSDIKDKELSFEDKKKVMDKLYSMGVKSIDFFGKEPLVDETVFYLMEYASMKGYNFEYSLITNGVNLDWYFDIILASPCSSITVSYDFSVERSFQTSLGLLGELSRYKFVELSIDVHKGHEKEIFKGVKEVYKKGIKSIYVKPILPYGSNAGNVNPMTEREFELFCNKLIKIKKRPYLFISVPFEYPSMTTCYEGVSGGTFQYLTDNHCSAGCDKMYIACDGTVYGCGMIACNGIKTNTCNILTNDMETIERTIRTNGCRMCGVNQK